MNGEEIANISATVLAHEVGHYANQFFFFEYAHKQQNSTIKKKAQNIANKSKHVQRFRSSNRSSVLPCAAKQRWAEEASGLCCSPGGIGSSEC